MYLPNERRNFNMKTSKISSKIMETMVEKFVKADANSTTCIVLHQPKAPAMLKKFSKVENDK